MESIDKADWRRFERYEVNLDDLNVFFDDTLTVS